MSSWYKEKNESIVVSSRIRLARNVEGFPFPSRMTDEQREELKKRVKSAVCDCDIPFATSLKYIDMKDVPSIEIKSMVERHVISPEFANSNKDRAIILSEDESISIMVGEEDHIRIQVILPGLQLEKAYEIAEHIDTLLYDKLHFAFSNELGFLTECPTNLGTGLRASVMLHLPICESNSEVSSLADTISKIGFTVRGIYGEGTSGEGSLYQVSNQITLGLSEKNAIENLKIITNQLVEKEISARHSIDKIKLKDYCFRALGTLKFSHILDSKEMMNLLSRVKLGIDMGIINTDFNPIEAMVSASPYMLMKKYGEIPAMERDVYRAAEIREKIS